MVKKYYNKQSFKRSRKRRYGKGITYITTQGKLRLIGLLMIVFLLLYVYRQFSLLFTNRPAITSFGWIFIGLLSFLFIVTFSVKTTQFIHYLKGKQVYELSMFYAQTKHSYTKVNKEKGKRFEYEISAALEEAFPTVPQLIDITLKRKNSVNESLQIDCILFHETGIYVLELKDYNGYVYGGKTNRYWNVGYENNGKKATYEFQNPILQNTKHIEDLKKFKQGEYVNIVIFSPNTTIDTDITQLHTIGSLKTFIRSRKPIYKNDLIKDYKGTIERYKQKDKTQDHIKRIQFNQAKYN